MAGPWEKYGGTSQPAPIIGPPKLPPPQTELQQQNDALTNRKLQVEIGEADEKRARGGLGPDKFSDLQGQRESITGFRQYIDELEQLYAQKLEGPDKGTLLGMGGDRNIGGYLPGAIRPENKVFEDKAMGLINVLAPMLGLTGTELNSLGEIQARFGPMIPSPSDSDENIRIKLDGLRRLADQQERGIAAQIGQEPSNPITDRVIQGNNQEQMQVATGDTRVEKNPALAGVNQRIGEMLQQGAGPRDILQFLKRSGASNEALLDVQRQLVEYTKFKKAAEAKGQRVGLPTIDLERWEVPNSTFNQISASPLGAAAIETGNVVTGNHLDNIVELAGGNGELANIGMEQMRQQNPLSSLAGGIVGGAGLYGAGRGALAALGRGAAPATGTFAAPAVAGDAAMGAYIGSGAGGTDMFDPASAALGGVAGAAGGVAGRGVINTAGRAISPTGGSLAPAYAEGVKPTIGQRMGGAFDRVEQAFASVPLVGGIQRTARNNAVQDWQAGAFNQALREIGTELPKGVKSGTQAHAYMQNQFNAAYNKARSGLTFRQDPEFVQDFRAVANEVAGLSPQAQARFTNIVKTGENKLVARGGVLSGDDYKTLVSGIEKRIRKIRKSPSGDYELADVLEDLTIALDKGARRHSAPEAVAALDAADRGYVKAVLIEEAGRKAGGGDFGEFTGKQLEAAVRSNSGLRSRSALRGDAPLQDYAAAGVRLGDSVPDSGTPERIMTTGGLASMAHFIDPLTLSPWIANTLANLPGGKQAVNILISPNRKALDPARRKLLERAHLGGLLAAPAAEGATQ